MKKSFKRAISVMLAVLMVVCSMPFTAFADTLVERTNYQWWVEEGLENVPGGITEAPDFSGHVSEDGATFGEEIYSADPDYRAEMKPIIAITVSDLGTASDWVAGSWATNQSWYEGIYGGASKPSYEAAKSHIINPANLSAGQRIAVTIEIGGFDVMTTGQVLGTYTSALTAANFKSKPQSKDTWTKLTAANANNAWFKTTATNGFAAAMPSSAAANGAKRTWQIVVNGAAAQNGDATTANVFMDNSTGAYIGKYGAVIGTLTFEVNEDGTDLTQAFKLNTGELGTNFEPYDRFVLRDLYGDDEPYVIVNDTDNGIAFAEFATIWSEYSTGSSSQHEHTYGTWSHIADSNPSKHTKSCTDSNCTGGEDATVTAECTFGEIITDTAATCCSTGLGHRVCADCGYELQVTLPVVGQHTIEDHDVVITPATCGENGVKNVEHYCTVGEKVISTDYNVTILATGNHTEAVKYENATYPNGTCAAGTQDKVTYCSVCNEVFSTEKVAADPTAEHTEAVKYENATYPNGACAAGTQDKVTYCSVCGEVFSTEKVAADPTAEHTDGEATYENASYPDGACQPGTRDEVVYCTVCGAETSRTQVTAPATAAHTDGEATYENASYPNGACQPGTRDEVINCTVCGAETSRTQVVAPATAQHSMSAWAHDDSTAEAASQHTRNCTVCGLVSESEGCDFTYAVITPATEVSTGVGRYTCQDCNYSYDVIIKKTDCAHADTVLINVKAVSCLENGYSGDTYCNVCEQVIDSGDVIPSLGHDIVVDAAVAPTCEGTGLTEGQHCSRCDDATVAQTEVPALGHDIVVDAAVAPTCEGTGLTEGQHCSRCNDKTVAQTEVPALGHDIVVDAAVAPTCEGTGLTEGQHCSRCNDKTVAQTEVPATGHTDGEPVVTITPATVDAEGEKVTVVKCTVCGEVTSTSTETLAVIPSYTVTVTAQDMGTVTINGINANDGAAVKVAKEPVGTVKLVATAQGDNQFVGWTANGTTLVSTSDIFVPAVLANVTYTPVFTKAAANDFTVTFVDAYGNVVSSQSVASGADVEIPAVPERAGYAPGYWSMTDEEIAAIDKATTITAEYDSTVGDGFTVTATGCTIVGSGIDAVDKATGVEYDTKVTVTATGAKSWTIDGVTVAYGESYTFYVGADVEVVPVFDGDEVATAPTVANVKVTASVAGNGLTQFTFLATRSMEGFELVNFGFVYGSGVGASTTLDDVNGAKIKALYCKTAAQQFSVTYGAKSQTGTLSARAFVAYVDGNGDTQVIYADTMSKSY